MLDIVFAFSSFSGNVDRGGEDKPSDFFQKRTEGEPALASLVHAVNNTVGLPLLTVEEMFAARNELHEAAGTMGLELYLGTDSTGDGDWPIEVAQHALYQKLAEGNITLESARFGVNKAGKVPKVVMEIVNGSHAHKFELLAELQFPTTDDGTGLECAGYHWRDLPVGKNGERGHFVAVRNGLVYDSAAPGEGNLGFSLLKYTHLRYTKKLYKVVVSGAEGQGPVQMEGEDAVPEAGEGQNEEGEDEEEQGGEQEDDAEGEDA